MLAPDANIAKMRDNVAKLLQLVADASVEYEKGATAFRGQRAKALSTAKDCLSLVESDVVSSAEENFSMKDALVAVEEFDDISMNYVIAHHAANAMQRLAAQTEIAARTGGANQTKTLLGDMRFISTHGLSRGIFLKGPEISFYHIGDMFVSVAAVDAANRLSKLGRLPEARDLVKTINGTQPRFEIDTSWRDSIERISSVPADRPKSAFVQSLSAGKRQRFDAILEHCKPDLRPTLEGFADVVLEVDRAIMSAKGDYQSPLSVAYAVMSHRDDLPNDLAVQLAEAVAESVSRIDLPPFDTEPTGPPNDFGL